MCVRERKTRDVFVKGKVSMCVYRVRCMFLCMFSCLFYARSTRSTTHSHACTAVQLPSPVALCIAAFSRRTGFPADNDNDGFVKEECCE